MNDPNKAISVNLSSLLSLKAELLRKQAEVNRAKETRNLEEEYSSNTSIKSGKLEKKNKPIEVSKNQDAKVYKCEDSISLENSKRILEAKSKFYDRMSRTGGSLNSDDNCLVLFNRKQQDQKPDSKSEAFEETGEKGTSSCRHDSSSDSDSDSVSNTDPEAWVEYTDCFGRTRNCLRKDLENVKKHDSELAASMPERLDQSKANWMIDTKGHSKNNKENVDTDDDIDTFIGPPAPPESVFSDGCSLMSKHDEQRVNWEKKEQENLEKSDVHYQDVFFDEARQHGVGYYAFSTDEEERQRQQLELEEARQRTKDEQERRDELRTQREKIIEERVRAAKNRQRARLGLPLLQAEDFEKEKNEKLKVKETKEERKERKRADKLKRRKETEEEERKKEREEYVRPWDEEKEGVKKNDCLKSSLDGFVSETQNEEEEEWTYKPERLPMSQEEWNEKQRAERKPEFAPVVEPQTRLKRTNFSKSLHPEQYNLMTPPNLPTATARNDMTFVSFQTSKREKTFQRKNYNPSNDECGDESDDRIGAAISPPASLDSDYGLPPLSKRPKTSNELERSMEAGLRFLRNNSDKDTMTTKSSWTSKADY